MGTLVIEVFTFRGREEGLCDVLQSWCTQRLPSTRRWRLVGAGTSCDGQLAKIRFGRVSFGSVGVLHELRRRNSGCPRNRVRFKSLCAQPNEYLSSIYSDAKWNFQCLCGSARLLPCLCATIGRVQSPDDLPFGPGARRLSAASGAEARRDGNASCVCRRSLPDEYGAAEAPRRPVVDLPARERCPRQ